MISIYSRSLMVLITVLAFIITPTIAEARGGIGGVGARGDGFRPGGFNGNVDGRHYYDHDSFNDNTNVDVDRYTTGGYSWNGRHYNYYHNGQYYNYYSNGNYFKYYYNGAYYNNCNTVAGYWLNGVWYPPGMQCW